MILGPVIGTGGTGTSTGGGGPTVGGGDTTGGGGGNDGGGGGGGGDGDGDGGVVVVLGPGDGREWGQSHKLTKGDGRPPAVGDRQRARARGRERGSRGTAATPPGHDPDHGTATLDGHSRTGTAGTGSGYSSTRYRIVGRISQSTCSLVTVPSCTHPAVS